MKVNAYCIFDQKLERANLPFFARSDQEAVVILVRSNPPKSLYNDLRLIRCGFFDDDTGLIEPCQESIPLPPIKEDQNNA